MLTLFLLLILLLLVTHWYFVHDGRLGKFIDLVPGPKVLPYLGNVLNVQVSSEGLWTFIREMGIKHYPIWRAWSIVTPFINIRHPDDVEASGARFETERTLRENSE
ncbi:hypothetical protein KM043_000261 [Ampulex compressa]|nr:hypothetical protein KM043_000261 [Ampulex compressa]